METIRGNEVRIGFHNPSDTYVLNKEMLSEILDMTVLCRTKVELYMSFLSLELEFCPGTTMENVTKETIKTLNYAVEHYCEDLKIKDIVLYDPNFKTITSGFFKGFVVLDRTLDLSEKEEIKNDEGILGIINDHDWRSIVFFNFHSFWRMRHFINKQPGTKELNLVKPKGIDPKLYSEKHLLSENEFGKEVLVKVVDDVSEQE